LLHKTLTLKKEGWGQKDSFLTYLQQHPLQFEVVGSNSIYFCFCLHFFEGTHEYEIREKKKKTWSFGSE